MYKFLSVANLYLVNYNTTGRNLNVYRIFTWLISFDNLQII